MSARVLRIRRDADLEVGYRWSGADRVPFPLSALSLKLGPVDDPVATYAGEADATAGDDWWRIYVDAATLDADLTAGQLDYVVLATRQSDGHVKAIDEGSAIVL